MRRLLLIPLVTLALGLLIEFWLVPVPSAASIDPLVLQARRLGGSLAVAVVRHARKSCRDVWLEVKANGSVEVMAADCRIAAGPT